MAKFMMTYGRTVRPAEFESTHIEVGQEYSSDTTWEDAYQEVKAFVEAKVLEALTPPNGQPATAPPSTDKHPSTPWKPTKNPNVEWCSERDAHPDDVKAAKANEGQRNAPMWYRPPQGDFQWGSIFRRTPR